MTKKRKSNNKSRFGKLFEVQLLYKNFFFLVFLTAIGILYIANSHRSEKKVRKIQEMQSDIEESKWKYWEYMSNVEYEGIQSQTEKRVYDLGLKSGEGSIQIIDSGRKPEDENE